MNTSVFYSASSPHQASRGITYGYPGAFIMSPLGALLLLLPLMEKPPKKIWDIKDTRRLLPYQYLTLDQQIYALEYIFYGLFNDVTINNPYGHSRNGDLYLLEEQSDPIGPGDIRLAKCSVPISHPEENRQMINRWIEKVRPERFEQLENDKSFKSKFPTFYNLTLQEGIRNLAIGATYMDVKIDKPCEYLEDLDIYAVRTEVKYHEEDMTQFGIPGRFEMIEFPLNNKLKMTLVRPTHGGSVSDYILFGSMAKLFSSRVSELGDTIKVTLLLPLKLMEGGSIIDCESANPEGLWESKVAPKEEFEDIDCVLLSSIRFSYSHSHYSPYDEKYQYSISFDSRFLYFIRLPGIFQPVVSAYVKI